MKSGFNFVSRQVSAPCPKLRFNTDLTRWDRPQHSLVVQFPLVISHDLRSFMVLRTVFSILKASADTTLTYCSWKIGMDFTEFTIQLAEAAGFRRHSILRSTKSDKLALHIRFPIQSRRQLYFVPRLLRDRTSWWRLPCSFWTGAW